MERIDIAVIGGGPAGASAAWEAARNDANAVVFERGVPRDDRDGLGPDSTDAGGLLDYWLEIMGFAPEEIPDELILRDIEGMYWNSPSASVRIDRSYIGGPYPTFGLAFDRAAFDDWLLEESEQAGASYHVGEPVTDVETQLNGSHSHTLTLGNGDQYEAEYLILADGPQRPVTTQVLDQFTPQNQQISDILNPRETNHIAYQEYRRVPEELEEPMLHFWWGYIPGRSAYPWIFPNRGRVVRTGLTMPIGLDADDYDADEWLLLEDDDEQIPDGATYLERLYEQEFPEYEFEDDFPLVEDRGKSNGTETYPISSTRPVESPTQAGIAATGAAMGGTSPFHEGGYHIAVATGKIAGRLAAADSLERYNEEWQTGMLGAELYRNASAANLNREYGPEDWDRTFSAADALIGDDRSVLRALKTSPEAARIALSHLRSKLRFKRGNYALLEESEYAL